jgi:hypothetical protein
MLGACTQKQKYSAYQTGLQSLFPDCFFYATMQNPNYDDGIWWAVCVYGGILSLPALLLGFTVAILNTTTQPVHKAVVATAILNLSYGLAIFICNADSVGPFTFYCYSLCFLLIGAYLMADKFAQKKGVVKNNFTKTG